MVPVCQRQFRDALSEAGLVTCGGSLWSAEVQVTQEDNGWSLKRSKHAEKTITASLDQVHKCSSSSLVLADHNHVAC